MKISKLRREANLTQVQLAEKLGYKTSSGIAQVESGHRKPWPKLRKRVAELFDVDWREVER